MCELSSFCHDSNRPECIKRPVISYDLGLQFSLGISQQIISECEFSLVISERIVGQSEFSLEILERIVGQSKFSLEISERIVGQSEFSLENSRQHNNRHCENSANFLRTFALDKNSPFFVEKLRNSRISSNYVLITFSQYCTIRARVEPGSKRWESRLTTTKPP